MIIDLPLGKSDLGGSASSPDVVKRSNEPFLSQALRTPEHIHYTSRSDVYQVRDEYFGTPSVSLGIQAIHQAFASHVPLTLSPDILWYMICHEVAICVKQNPKRYAHLFNGDPDNEKIIEVRDDSLVWRGNNDWMRSINLVRKPLREAMSENTVNLFTPRFSTTTPESETAVLVAFMDIISSYYKFKWSTLCGIPRIRLEGTHTDWWNLAFRAEALEGEFPDLKEYFHDLLPVLSDIAYTVSGGRINKSFWRSIYKYQSSSGGPYVSGWITAFMAYIPTSDGFEMKKRFDWRKEIKSEVGLTTDQFPSHVSAVPFVWDYLGTSHNMTFAAGIFGVDHEKGFLAPRLGFGVFEPKQ